MTTPNLHQASFRYTLEEEPGISDEISSFFKEVGNVVPAIWLQDIKELGFYDSDIKAHGLFYFTVIKHTCLAFESKRIDADRLPGDMHDFLFKTRDKDMDYLKRATVHLRYKTGHMHETVQRTFYWVVFDEPPPFYQISKKLIQRLISDVRTMGEKEDSTPEALVAVKTMGVPVEATLKKRKVEAEAAQK